MEHPGAELQVLIKEKGLTQKAFASILGKKVSEVNELLKGKRNITIQRDYLLHQTLGTPIKYWILKQVDYDYSLIDIDETNLITPQSLRENSPNKEQNSDDNFTPLGGEGGETRGGGLHQTRHSEQSEVYSASGKSIEHQTSHSGPEERENPSNATPMDFSFQSKGQEKPEDEIQVAPLGKKKKEEIGNNSKNDEDFKKRANIFKTF